MLNLMVITGRLTADPELKTTPNGVSVTSFTVAVDRPYQRSGQERQADFFDVVAWRNTAEFITRFFHKGNLICVQGYMTTRTYEDKNGIRRKVYELVADSSHFCESKKSREEGPVVTTPKAAYPAPQPLEPAQTEPSYSQTGFDDFTEISSDDDLPFN